MQDRSSMDTEPTEGSWLGQKYIEILAACAAVVLVLIVRSFVKRVHLRLPPDPPRWPLIGHALFVLGNRNSTPLHLIFATLHENYGPIFRFDLAGSRSVVISSAELAKDVLETQDSIFASRPQKKSIMAEVVFFNQDLIFEPLGHRFRFLRKILAMELLSQKRLEAFKEIRRQEVIRAIQRILKEGRDEQPVNVDGIFLEMSLNHMTRMMVNKAFYGQKVYTTEEEKELVAFDSLTAFVTSMPLTGLGDMFPWLRKFDLDGHERRARKLKFQFESFLGNIIQEHRQKDLSDEKAEIMDFVDVLLQVENDKGNEARGLSDDSIMALLVDMMVAGVDSSRVTLLWAIAELLRNPELLRNVRQELDAVVGKGRLVDESDIDDLPYLQAFIFEVFRRYSPAPVSPIHVSTKATKLGGYDIPANTGVMVNFHRIHTDPKYWTNPLEFNPSRWFNVDGELDHKRRQAQCEFLPFSGGRRKCPGLNMAVTFSSFALAQIVHTCDLSLPPGVKPQDVRMEEMGVLVNAMKYSYEGIFTPRLPKSVYMESGITL